MMKFKMNINKVKEIRIIISLVIIIGFIATAIINYLSYSKIIKDDIHNISKLTSTNIYSEIHNELVKPIFVSLTMANDSFVIEWLHNEKSSNEDDMIKYLDRISEKYNYDSSFLISEETKKYYHYDGILKEVSKKNDHDDWYYKLLKKDALYALDVDQDEADKQRLTIFVNCKIYDENDKFLGVIGVGVKMKQIQELLSYYKDNFSVDAYLIDEEGLIQAHTDSDIIEKRNVFDQELFIPIKEEIINNKTDMLSFNMKYDTSSGYLISRYVKEMQWLLIIEKDTSILKKSFYKQMIMDFIVLGVVILVVLIITTMIINKYKKQLTKVAQTDQLTNIMNRRAFDQCLKNTILISQQTRSKRNFCMFIFDIDNFKRVNDIYGHLFGDKIILQIVNIVSKQLKEPNVFSRWGGDEFTGVIFEDVKKSEDMIYKILNEINENAELSKFNITISVGLTKYQENDNETTIVRRADKALYKSKHSGKKQMTVL